MRGESRSDREEINTQENLEGKEESGKREENCQWSKATERDWIDRNFIWSNVELIKIKLIWSTWQTFLIGSVKFDLIRKLIETHLPCTVDHLHLMSFFGLVDQLKIRWVCPPMRLPRETQCLWLKRKGRFFHFLVFRALCAFEKKMSWMAQTKGSSHHLVTSEACQLFKIVFYSDNADGNISVE